MDDMYNASGEMLRKCHLSPLTYSGWLFIASPSGLMGLHIHIYT